CVPPICPSMSTFLRQPVVQKLKARAATAPTIPRAKLMVLADLPTIEADFNARAPAGAARIVDSELASRVPRALPMLVLGPGRCHPPAPRRRPTSVRPGQDRPGPPPLPRVGPFERDRRQAVYDG